MSLPTYVIEHLTDELRLQMDGVAALTGKLARQRLAPEALACVAGVGEAAAGIRRIMDAALDLKQMSISESPVALEPVRLRELMDEVQDRWLSRAAGAGINVLVSYAGDPEATALADRSRLLQVFDGFIGEAVGVQSRGAVEASLQVTATADRLRLAGAVRGPRDAAWGDTDAESRFRCIAARLGLEAALGALLAQRIVTGMGGELRKETHAGGAESCAFELELAPAPVSAEAHEAAASRAAHILVVDDNATNRMVAQSLVEMFDCTSESAEDGEEAVEAARSGRFDLILMDIRMPRMDGVAATRAIRALPGRVGQTPIIALTANADPEDAAGYLAAGMNGVVEKPMKPEHLLVALQQALSAGDSAAAA